MTFGFATSASQIHIYLNSLLNERALEGTFNQEKAIVGAYFMIVKADGSFTALVLIAMITADPSPEDGGRLGAWRPA